MSYPKFVKGESTCAYCDNEIEDEFVTVADNHMILNYFSYEDGEDNIFCNKDCLCEALFVESVSISEDVENE